MLACACGGATGQVASPKATPLLTEAGALPRQRLRYQPVPGRAEPVELSMKLRIGSTVTHTVLETEHRDVDFPAVTLIGRIEASALNASGEVTFTLHVEDVEVLDDAVNPNVRRKTAEQASTLKGSRTTWHMSPTGHTSDWTSDAGSLEGVKSELRDVLLDAFVIFPEQEVGIVWKLAGHVESRHPRSPVGSQGHVQGSRPYRHDGDARHRGRVASALPGSTRRAEPDDAAHGWHGRDHRVGGDSTRRARSNRYRARYDGIEAARHGPPPPRLVDDHEREHLLDPTAAESVTRER